MSQSPLEVILSRETLERAVSALEYRIELAEGNGPQCFRESGVVLAILREAVANDRAALEAIQKVLEQDANFASIKITTK